MRSLRISGRGQILNGTIRRDTGLGSVKHTPHDSLSAVAGQSRIVPIPMPLSVGDRLGPYEILAPIGAGGMGEVYRATDTRLGRIVAIKVLNGPHSERFEQDARAIAALNDAHICTPYIGLAFAQELLAGGARKVYAAARITPAWNAIHCPSGEKNGGSNASVPASSIESI